MKSSMILLFLCIGLALLCGCGQDPGPSPQSKADGEPLNITYFSFSHSSSSSDGCFHLELSREASGIHVHVEELFYGGRVGDAILQSDMLDRLGKLAGEYHIDQWNGFNKSNSLVSDGSSFTLRMTLEDGTTVFARGNNSFPEHYSVISSAVRDLYLELMEEYGQAQENAE